MTATTKTSANGKIQGTGPGGRITRDDLANKLRAITGDKGPDESGSMTNSPVLVGVLVGGLVVVAYLLGRRRSKSGRALVEIRRI